MTDTRIPLSDRLHDIERQFKQNPTDGESDVYERRLILRRAFEDYGRECHAQGYQDGTRDLSDARWEAQKCAEIKARQDGTEQEG